LPSVSRFFRSSFVLLFIILVYINPLQRSIQYCVGFLYIRKFSLQNGMHPTSPACDSSGFYPNIDTLFAIITTVFAYMTLCPALYLISKILVPGRLNQENEEMQSDETIMKNKVIGTADVSLKDLLLSIGKQKVLPPIDLLDEKNAKAGVIELTVVLTPNLVVESKAVDSESIVHVKTQPLAPEPAPQSSATAASFDQVELENGGIIHIQKIVCSKLKNVKRMYGHKNDPFVTFCFGSSGTVQKTPAQQNMG
jgi:hypothetical protein